MKNPLSEVLQGVLCIYERERWFWDKAAFQQLLGLFFVQLQ
jgi:hypothetical protein